MKMRKVTILASDLGSHIAFLVQHCPFVASERISQIGARTEQQSRLIACLETLDGAVEVGRLLLLQTEFYAVLDPKNLLPGARFNVRHYLGGPQCVPSAIRDVVSRIPRTGFEKTTPCACGREKHPRAIRCRVCAAQWRRTPASAITLREGEAST